VDITTEKFHRFYNGKHFVLVNRISSFGIFEFGTIKSNWTPYFHTFINVGGISTTKGGFRDVLFSYAYLIIINPPCSTL